MARTTLRLDDDLPRRLEADAPREGTEPVPGGSGHGRLAGPRASDPVAVV